MIIPQIGTAPRTQHVPVRDGLAKPRDAHWYPKDGELCLRKLKLRKLWWRIAAILTREAEREWVKIPEPDVAAGNSIRGIRRRRRGEPWEELSFLFNSLPTLEAAPAEVRSSPGWKEHRRQRGVRCARRPLEIWRTECRPRPVVLITASGLQGGTASGRWNNVGREVSKMDPEPQGKGLARGLGWSGPNWV
ncbi:hypothetical protein NL676_007036 [Syzygium grande]|nr:hypothetical protein NL676_007036 [Syzygium grande]